MSGEPRRRWLERRVVQFLLRAGLTVAAALMALGLFMAVLGGRFTAHPVTFDQVASLLRRGRPSGYMTAGLLVLLATPIARVLALIVGFSIARDWRFVAVATAVAGLLVLGLLVGRI
jgi:uncharacterized membrane protein